MEWSNEKVIEFLELFAMEPSLRDPRSKLHKNRGAQSDAWRRIIQSLSFEISLDALKGKKESLMGYYRIHLNKLKKSKKSGVGTDDIYKTNWFAFSLMDSFLRPIYVTNSILNTESTSEENSAEENSFFNKSIENESVSDSLFYTDCSTNNKATSTFVHPVKKFKQPFCLKTKVTTPPEIINAEKQMNEAFGCLKAINDKKKELDEYDYFAGIIASKIRKIENIDDREQLMNCIQNLIYEFYAKSRNSNLSAQTVTSAHSTLISETSTSPNLQQTSQQQQQSMSVTHDGSIPILSNEQLLPVYVENSGRT